MSSANSEGTPRSSHVTPISTSLSTTWLPPKSPLPPHRLAKLANALGVSTPIPAVHSPTSSFLSRSYSETSGPIDHLRRSPTPSIASSANYNTYNSATSKFLLHVIPPMDLPHDSTSNYDSSMTPAPTNASGYHTHFRRGILVPVHANFQTQLGAIAKEYALPSTAGLVLYLVSSAKQGNGKGAGGSLIPPDDDEEEPGPRLSEGVWKHLWTRILKEERDENNLLSSRSATPHLLSLGTGLGARSTPFLPLGSAPSPRSGTETIYPRPSYHITASPSTPSSVSDLRSNTKSAPPSSSSEPGTPNTSIEDYALRANSLDLPGLHSSSVIPILAKVEFDIDRRKATWYDPWLRSRRVNHAKRAESRASERKDSVSHETSSSEDKKPPLPLLIGGKETISPMPFIVSPIEQTTSPVPFIDSLVEEIISPTPFTASLSDEPELHRDDPAVNGYTQLEEFPEEGAESDSDSSEEDYEEDATARVTLTTEAIKDPLQDVFGSDADTWADIHSEHRNSTSTRESNPNVVNLALNAGELSDQSITSELDNRIASKEEDEVNALLEEMSRQHLSRSKESLSMARDSASLSADTTRHLLISREPDSLSADKGKRSSSPTSQARKRVPPPLTLVHSHSTDELLVSSENTPISNGEDGTNLPYLRGAVSDKAPAQTDEHDEDFNKYTRVRSPAESEKRGGALFEDLDLGLDPTEDYDDTDPNDRRRSQFIMKAQLDEIEKTLAQLSPRILQTDLEDDQNRSFHSITASPKANSLFSLSPRTGRNSDFFPASPRLPQHPDPVENSDADTKSSWPAVPFSLLKDNTQKPLSDDLAPSPPRLVINGVSTGAPAQYATGQTSSSKASAETAHRKKEQEEENALYDNRPSSSRSIEVSSQSPVIPLSPDPFGRYPSTPDIGRDSVASTSNWDMVTVGRGSVSVTETQPSTVESYGPSQRSAGTSRFSADSMTGVLEEPTTKTSNRTTLMSVKNFKKLWRKSKDKNNSISVPGGLTPTSTAPSSGRTSPNVPPPPPPQRPDRPLQDHMDLPDVPPFPMSAPVYGRLSPQPIHIPPERRASEDQVPTSLLQSQQLPVPVPFAGRSLNPSPIIAAQMRPGKGAPGMDRLKFDQESPYPIRQPPPIRQNTRPPSPPQPPVIYEKEKATARKSILKSWKSLSSSSGNVSPNPTTEPQPRSSFERINGTSSRGKRPSVINFGSNRSTVTSPDIPPSPQIPEHFINATNNAPQMHRTSHASKSPASSVDLAQSHPGRQQPLIARSISPQSISSRDSGETRPSFDASQFEIVSPKTSSLSYPYHDLDHQ